MHAMTEMQCDQASGGGIGRAMSFVSLYALQSSAEFYAALPPGTIL